MNKIQIFGGILAVSLTSAALYAAPGMTADGVTKGEALAKADKRFAKMDVNNDGALNQADRDAKVKVRFAKLDADNNGVVSESEFVASHEARMEKRQDRREMREERRGPGHKGRRMGGRGGGMRMLALADTNRDQSVSKAEFRAAAEARFTKADANNDGVISMDERKSQRPGKWGNRLSGPGEAN